MLRAQARTSVALAAWELQARRPMGQLPRLMCAQPRPRPVPYAVRQPRRLQMLSSNPKQQHLAGTWLALACLVALSSSASAQLIDRLGTRLGARLIGSNSTAPAPAPAPAGSCPVKLGDASSIDLSGVATACGEGGGAPGEGVGGAHACTVTCRHTPAGGQAAKALLGRWAAWRSAEALRLLGSVPWLGLVPDVPAGPRGARQGCGNLGQ